MEHFISNLLSRYEKGTLTRRQAIEGFAMLAATGGAASAAEGQDNAQIRGNSINHVSIRVSDLERSVEFYQNLFGLSISDRNDASPETVRLIVGSSHLSIRRRNPPGTVDHFAIGLDNFDRDSVREELRARGLTPHEDIDTGLHVNDPDGFNVQFTSGAPGREG